MEDFLIIIFESRGQANGLAIASILEERIELPQTIFRNSYNVKTTYRYGFTGKLF